MMHWLSPSARFVALLVLLSAPSLTAQETTPTIDLESDSKTAFGASRNDEVWFVSTRHLCFPRWDDPSTYALDVRRYERESGWRESSTEEFIALPALPTVVYVHGNRTDWSEASQHGWQVYESLAGCCNGPPTMRFVIWTWPSDQLRRPLRDVRVKAGRADNETFFLGWFLSQLKPASRVSLIGYSYGSRIITGGLHLLAGGSLGGIHLPHPAEAGRAPARVALLAPALDHDWLYPGHCHGAALEQMDHLHILYNSCDPALQYYDRLYRCSRVAALGYVGLSLDGLGVFSHRVEQFDAAPFVGRSHEEDHYFSSSNLKQEICRVLFNPLPTPNGGG